MAYPDSKLYICDVTLRDGMHALRHQYDPAVLIKIAQALDAAKVDAIEISHGDGLAGVELQLRLRQPYRSRLDRDGGRRGEARQGDDPLDPGHRHQGGPERGVSRGARSVRVATHCTEADISKQHIETARSIGMDTVGFLMMAHMLPADRLVEQAKLMESYGATCVYVTDSAGALLPEQAAERVKRFRGELKPETQIGIHAHHNLSFGVANSVAAVQNGRDPGGCLPGRDGRGGGERPDRDRGGRVRPAGLEPWLRPVHADGRGRRPGAAAAGSAVRVDRESLSLGYAGVYSRFLRHAERASSTYGIDARDILVELGRRRMVGGQEDMIVDVALDLVKQREAGKAAQ